MLDLMEEGRKVAVRLSATNPQNIRKPTEVSTPAREGLFSHPQDPQNPQALESRNNDKIINPLWGLEITTCNLNWVNKILSFRTAKQRFELLTEYRRIYLESADAIPEQQSHKKSNAGTYAANVWLRETLQAKHAKW